MLGPGTPNRWLAPSAPDGYRRSEGQKLIGSHTGDYTGMCLVEIEPGFETQWVSLIGADGTMSTRGERVVMAQARGWQVVRRGGRTKAAVDNTNIPNAPRGQTTEGDGEPIIFGTQILMRIPSFRLAEMRQRDLEESHKQVKLAPQAFFNNASENEIKLGQGRPTRFARSDHHGTVEQGGEVVDTLYDSTLPRE